MGAAAAPIDAPGRLWSIALELWISGSRAGTSSSRRAIEMLGLMSRCCLLVGLCALLSPVYSLRCYQDGGNWTSPTAQGSPQECTSGAFCRSVAIKSLQSTQKVYLYDCAAVCESVANKKSTPTNVKNPKPVLTSITCCNTDGCNGVAPTVHSGASSLAPSLALSVACLIVALGAGQSA